MKNILKIVGIGSIVLASMFSSMKNVEAQDKANAITGEISTGLNSHYIPPMGYVLGKGPHQQSNLSISSKGFTAFVWSDYDFGAKAMNEIDFGLNYSKQIENTSLTIGTTYWHYPSPWNDDVVAQASVGHNNKINKELSGIYLFKDKGNEAGAGLKAKFSKNFNLGEKFSLEPEVSAAYLKNFYGDTGFSQITPGATVNYNKGNVNLTGFTGYQWGFMPEPELLPPIRNQLHGNVTLSVGF